MPVQDQLVQIGRLLVVEAVHGAVVQDEQVRGQEEPEGAVLQVVHPHLGHGPKEAVGMDEPDGVPRLDSSVAQDLGQEVLAHPGGPHQQHILVLVQELLGEDGTLQPKFDAPDLPSADLVGEDDPPDLILLETWK